MAQIERTYPVPARGIGRPDYSQEVSLGVVRSGYRLKESQRIKLFSLACSNTASPYPFVMGPLAPAIPTYMIDAETGLAMPFHINQGYTFEITAFLSKFSEDVMHELNLDGVYSGYFNYIGGGESLYHNEVFAVTTGFWDPTAASAHDWGIYITNLGTANMLGGSSLWCFLNSVGTAPLPDKKTVRCKFCGHEWEVPLGTTQINCPACGELNRYFNLSQLRGIP